MAPRKSAPKVSTKKKAPVETPDAKTASKKRKATTSKANEFEDGQTAPKRTRSLGSGALHLTQDRKRGRPSKTVGVNASKPRQLVNEVPTTPLDIFVFGDGSCAQLGLGSKPVGNLSPTEAVVPTLNPLLSSTKVGVVQFACGGMHTVALTVGNTILTWGVNDLGALGRDTNVEEDDDDELNPAESAPGRVSTEQLGPDITWFQVAASDSASFALTDDGRVYGWGTFRSSEGTMGFSAGSFIQKTPALIPDLKDIRQLAAGNNHVLALDGKGKVFTWGSGEAHQLARKIRRPERGLRPASIGSLPVRGAKACKVGCGSYHSFVIDQKGRVYAWGLNVFGELAIPDNAGEDGASQLRPRLVENLQAYQITDIAGGEHHSLACTDKGELLTWGRVDGKQVGLQAGVFTADNTIFDDRNVPRILKTPLVVPNLPSIAAVASGTDHSLAVTVDGKAYSWGFSANGRTGQRSEDDLEVPTLVNGKSIRERKLVFAGAGGAFSVVASAAQLA